MCPSEIYITYTLRSQYKNHGNIWRIITLTKTYEDGIMDALRIIKRYTDVGVYSVPTIYIEQALINHLPSAYKIDLKDITNEPKKSQEV